MGQYAWRVEVGDGFVLGTDDADLRFGRGFVLDGVGDDADDRALAFGGRLGERRGAGCFFGG